MSKLTVAKFGGTSVANFDAMLRCAQIIKNDLSNRVVVVSASAGVTNYLVRLAQANVSELEQQEIISAIAKIQHNIAEQLPDKERYFTFINGKLSELTSIARQQSVQFNAKYADEILSYGEQFSSMLFAQVLCSVGLKAQCFDVRQVMKTNSLYGKAVVDNEALKSSVVELLVPLLNDQVIVTQGFIGQDGLGHTTTLGRGGSDFSAALLAEALDADNLSIWTDVVGIFAFLGTATLFLI